MSDISYLTIYNPHSGDTFKVSKPVRFQNLTSFKSYLQELLNIENKEDIFLLTSFGIRLNYNLINELNEVYVFDKRLFSNGAPTLVQDHSGTELANISKPTASQLQVLDMNVKSITNALKSNSVWSNAIYQNSFKMTNNIKQIIRQINVVFKSLNIIFQFATNFINEIEKKFNIDFNHIKLINLKSLHNSWKEHYKKLKKFPILQFSSCEIDIIKLLNYEELQSSADHVAEHLPSFVKRFNEMSTSINKVNEKKLEVDKKIETLRNESIRTFKGLNLSLYVTTLQDISNNINNDIERISSGSPIDLEETYHLHKNTYSTKLYNISIELYNFHESLLKFKLRTITESIDIFNIIANLQLEMVLIKNDLKLLTNPNENNSSFSYENLNQIRRAEDHLSLCIDLPLLLGFILIEKRRQFEWQDFFSKGIVNNSSEQFTGLIDNERLFRKIWIKKFGVFLSFLSKEPMEIPLPHLDITLINPKVDLENFLTNLMVERDDILKYIETLEKNNYSKNFVNLLNKNFKDLVRCTENMKNITKTISLMSSHNFDEKGRALMKLNLVDNNDGDNDVSLVNGLKRRIKKLENLLHQQQYKDLSNWPVTRNNPTVLGDVRKSVLLQSSGQNSTPTPKINPTLLLNKTSIKNSKDNSVSTSPLDSSVVDKHLDNIRLIKENKDILQKMEEQRVKHDNEVHELRAELEKLKNNNIMNNEAMKSRLIEKDREIAKHRDEKISIQENFNEISKKYTEKKKEATELLEKLKTSNEQSENKIISLNDDVLKIKLELDENKEIRKNLQANISSKEADFIRERNILEAEIRDLKAKFDDITDKYENLLDLTETKEKNNNLLVNDLNNTIISLMSDVVRVSRLVNDYFIEFCYTLESLGLLLVKDDNEYKITRVKGLKLKKNESDSQKFIENLSSTVIDEVNEHMAWIDNIVSIKSILPENTNDTNDEPNKFNDQSVFLLSTFNRIFTSDSNEFEKFLKLISFTENIQLQENSDYPKRFFLNAISKRFKDIEGFAKKQTKDSKIKSQELNKLISKLKHKISMNEFQVDDLVLFLPTRIDGIKDDDAKQPWAAFNIGAPHYFLNNAVLREKDWMLGRVTNILERTVTESNYENKELNPFQLSIGVKWFLVDAKEEYA